MSILYCSGPVILVVIKDMLCGNAWLEWWRELPLLLGWHLDKWLRGAIIGGKLVFRKQNYKSWRTNYFSGKIIIRDITGIAIEKIHQKQSRKIIHEITDVHKKLYKNLSENGWLKTHPNVGKVG